MSDDEEEMQMDFSLDQGGGDGHDMMGFGPLLPTESERTLMERVRQELKIELKQVMFFLQYSSSLILLFSWLLGNSSHNTIIPQMFCRDSNQESRM